MSYAKILRHGQRVFEENSKTFVVGKCIVTGEKYTTKALNRKGLIDWLAGNEPISIALPSTSIVDREFLISGMGPKEQEIVFGKSTDEPLFV